MLRPGRVPALLLVLLALALALPGSAQTVTPADEPPRFPGFAWSAPETTVYEIGDGRNVNALSYLSAPNAQVSAQVALVEAPAWYQREFAARGWQPEPGPIGGGLAWGLRFRKGGQVAVVTGWQGEEPADPPLRPEVGYRQRIVLYYDPFLPAARPTFATEPVGVLDFDVAGGHFYRHANGVNGLGEGGFAIVDDEQGRFWSAYQRLGGPEVLGYPISQRFLWDGQPAQATQRAVLVASGPGGEVVLAPLFDRLHEHGQDTLLRDVYQVPPQADLSDQAGLAREEAAERRRSWYEGYPALAAAYRSVADPIGTWGLPTAPVQETSSGRLLRTQNVVFVQPAGDPAAPVRLLDGGEIARDLGLIPFAAQQPLPPDAAPGDQAAACRVALANAGLRYGFYNELSGIAASGGSVGVGTARRLAAAARQLLACGVSEEAMLQGIMRAQPDLPLERERVEPYLQPILAEARATS